MSPQHCSIVTATVVALTLVLTGCNKEDEAVQADPSAPADASCSYAPCDCEVSAEALVPARVTTAPLLVRGTARHAKRLAIRNVIVAATPATSGAFDFATWSVTLERAALEALPRSEAGDAAAVQVELPIEIIDHSGRTCVQQVRASFELALPADAPPVMPDAGDAQGDAAMPRR